jgi:DNA polymerase-1
MVKENLIKCYTEVELPLITALFDMEKNGILIDKNAMKSLSEEWGTEILRIERQIYEISGDEFNINSSQQIGEILFTKLGLPSLKKSKKKTQYSTDVEVLTELAKIHPLPEKILAYRNLVKLKSTYADGLYSSINHHTGRIHTSYNQTLAVTGRISSTNPNLQNIPIRTHEGKKIRKLFIAKPGYTLVSADYSQIDLRVLAFYSNDDNLVKSFIEDMDIHARTASLVYGVPADMVSADMRRTAKTINFGIIYGMSPFGLSRALGIDTKKASEFIKTYFEKYPGVKKYMEEIIESARSHGYVKTILDRRRYIPNIKSNNKNIRESAERIAINTPIQGSSADIIKLAMKNIYGNLLNDNDCKMLLQVHDELLFEAKSEKIGFYVKIIKDIMENSYKINVPLRVNISLGANWEEIEKLSI